MNLSAGLSVEELDSLIGKQDYRLFLNPRNDLYRERNMKENPPPRAEALQLMAAHPNLVRRPIFAVAGKVVAGFDPLAVLELVK